MRDSGATVAGGISDHVESSGASEGTLAIEERQREGVRAAWQRIIDKYLIEWGQDPGKLADDDVQPPSRAIIDLACKLAIQARDEAELPPLRVVPDGEGGIAFERRDGSYFQSLNLLHDGVIELVTFEDCRIVSRVRLA